jgi:hypothetical protein
MIGGSESRVNRRIVRDRSMPANWWTRPPKDDKCWQQYTFGVGTFARIDKRPPTLVGRLITRSVRFIRTEKACRAPHDVVG